MEIELKSGFIVGADIYDDTGKHVGHFNFCCSKCGSEVMDVDILTMGAFCTSCLSQRGYKLDGEIKRPKDRDGRKHMSFEILFEDGSKIEIVHTCSSCEHDLHYLNQHTEGNPTITTCERCGKTTSRKEGVVVESQSGGAPNWDPKIFRAGHC